MLEYNFYLVLKKKKKIEFDFPSCILENFFSHERTNKWFININKFLE